VYEAENGGAWSLPVQQQQAEEGEEEDEENKKEDEKKDMHKYLPVIHHVTDLVGDDKVAAIRSIVMKDRLKNDMKDRPSFYMFRTILDTAKDMEMIALAAMSNMSGLVFVDPYTLGLLVKCMSGLDCSVVE